MSFNLSFFLSPFTFTLYLFFLLSPYCLSPFPSLSFTLSLCSLSQFLSYFPLSLLPPALLSFILSFCLSSSAYSCLILLLFVFPCPFLSCTLTFFVFILVFHSIPLYLCSPPPSLSFTLLSFLPSPFCLSSSFSVLIPLPPYSSPSHFLSCIILSLFFSHILLLHLCLSHSSSPYFILSPCCLSFFSSLVFTLALFVFVFLSLPLCLSPSPFPSFSTSSSLSFSYYLFFFAHSLLVFFPLTFFIFHPLALCLSPSSFDTSLSDAVFHLSSVSFTLSQFNSPFSLFRLHSLCLSIVSTSPSPMHPLLPFTLFLFSVRFLPRLFL